MQSGIAPGDDCKNVGSMRIRSGKELTSPQVRIVPENTPMRVIQVDANRAYVSTYDGTVGWISLSDGHGAQLCVKSSTPGMPTPAARSVAPTNPQQVMPRQFSLDHRTPAAQITPTGQSSQRHPQQDRLICWDSSTAAKSSLCFVSAASNSTSPSLPTTKPTTPTASHLRLYDGLQDSVSACGSDASAASQLSTVLEALKITKDNIKAEQLAIIFESLGLDKDNISAEELSAVFAALGVNKGGSRPGSIGDRSQSLGGSLMGSRQALTPNMPPIQVAVTRASAPTRPELSNGTSPSPVTSAPTRPIFSNGTSPSPVSSASTRPIFSNGPSPTVISAAPQGQTFSPVSLDTRKPPISDKHAGTSEGPYAWVGNYP